MAHRPAPSSTIDQNTLPPELKEVLDLLKRAAATPRCPTTAKALYNAAHERLDAMERFPESPNGKLVRNHRRGIRAELATIEPLRERIQRAAELWTRALSPG